MPPESLPRSALLRPAKRLQYVCFSVRSRLWDHGLPSFLFKQKLLSEANSFALPILRKRFSRTPRAKATGHIEYANMQCWASASPSTFYFFINHLYPFETQKTLRIKEYIHLGFSSTRDPGGHLRGLWVCRGQQRRRSGAALSRDRHREQRRGRAGAGPGAFVNHTRA